jgi:hypothetical protein
MEEDIATRFERWAQGSWDHAMANVHCIEATIIWICQLIFPIEYMERAFKQLSYIIRECFQMIMDTICLIFKKWWLLVKFTVAWIVFLVLSVYRFMIGWYRYIEHHWIMYAFFTALFSGLAISAQWFQDNLEDPKKYDSQHIWYQLLYPVVVSANYFFYTGAAILVGVPLLPAILVIMIYTKFKVTTGILDWWLKCFSAVFEHLGSTIYIFIVEHLWPQLIVFADMVWDYIFSPLYKLVLHSICLLSFICVTMFTFIGSAISVIVGSMIKLIMYGITPVVWILGKLIQFTDRLVARFL